jgi:hypothetical protein
MIELDFAIDHVKVEPFSIAPQLTFALRIENKTPGIAVCNVMLNIQIRIEPMRRRYADSERDALSDLFGSDERWTDTLRSFLWTQASLTIPAVTESCLADLPVPCSQDFNIAGTKYFHGLESGEVPLSFLFSGSVFYRDQDEALQVGQISWSKECPYRLPIAVWKEMIEQHYAGRTWLCLEREAFDALYRYKRHNGLPTFEVALKHLLEDRMEAAS